jgi:hypothetical protein
MPQPEVSKLERRTNPQLAALTRFIQATGADDAASQYAGSWSLAARRSGALP